MARPVAQYAGASPRAVEDPYIASPVPLLTPGGLAAAKANARPSPVKHPKLRTSVKEGAKPTGVVRTATGRVSIQEVLNQKRHAAYSELERSQEAQQQASTTADPQRPQSFSLIDDDQELSHGSEDHDLQVME